ncbi:hypothetical protein AAHE18_10G249300 [Arachis hypogaea]
MSSELQTIGKEIAKKCKGVPLAIKTIGGLLRMRVDEIDQWSSLLHGAIWRLCEEEKSIMPVLNLSYRNLRPELRQCFEYHLTRTKTQTKAKMNVRNTCWFPRSLNRKRFPNPRHILLNPLQS